MFFFNVFLYKYNNNNIIIQIYFQKVINILPSAFATSSTHGSMSRRLPEVFGHATRMSETHFLIAQQYRQIAGRAAQFGNKKNPTCFQVRFPLNNYEH